MNPVAEWCMTPAQVLKQINLKITEERKDGNSNARKARVIKRNGMALQIIIEVTIQ